MLEKGEKKLWEAALEFLWDAFGLPKEALVESNRKHTLFGDLFGRQFLYEMSDARERLPAFGGIGKIVGIQFFRENIYDASDALGKEPIPVVRIRLAYEESTSVGEFLTEMSIDCALVERENAPVWHVDGHDWKDLFFYLL